MVPQEGLKVVIMKYKFFNRPFLKKKRAIDEPPV
jgi:hypothetical protein